MSGSFLIGNNTSSIDTLPYIFAFTVDTDTNELFLEQSGFEDLEFSIDENGFFIAEFTKENND